jgi:hypothetical protein
MAVFEQPRDLHWASTVWAQKRIDFPDLLDEFAPLFAWDPVNGIVGKLDDFDGIIFLRQNRRQAGVRMGSEGQALGEGLGSLFMVSLFLLLGKVCIGTTDGNLGGVGVDAPVPGFVGIGQRAARHRRANPHMEQLRMKPPKAGLDVAKAFPIGQLGEQHAKQLIPAGKRTNMLVSRISRDAGAKTPIREKVHDLRENDPTRVHAPSWLTEGGMLSANSNRCRSLSFVNNRNKTGYNKINLI